ncbi:MAG TPA: hypothetical protein DCS93_06150 [Microscillaceae bacterium]|nr:hypothetical protein [Microscillaceae bacterium]
MIEPLQLNATYQAERLDDHRILLNGEVDGVILTNTIGNMILQEVIQNALSLKELTEKLSGKGVPPFDTMQAVLALKSKGYITEVRDFFTHEQAAYWENQGFNAARLAQVLQQKHIQIIDLGRVDHLAFEAACQQSQLQLSDTPDIHVVLTDDYHHPELSQLNQRFEQDKTPWMLVKPTGTTLWLGPVFIPGETACWECLHHRIDLHNPINKFYRSVKNTDIAPAKPLVSHPVVTQMASSLAVLELVKWLYNPEKHLLQGKILSLNTQTLEKQLHTVVKRPQCSVCGDGEVKHPQPITLQKSQMVSDLGGYRAVSPEKSFEKYKHHVSPVSGIVSQVKPYGALDHPRIHNYASGRNLALQSISMFWLNHHLRSGNGGKGKTEAQAKMGALGEAIERYCLMYQGNACTIKASLDTLPEGIHPNTCMNYSEAQMTNRDALNLNIAKFYELIPVPFDSTKVIDWSPVYSLTEQKFKYLPAIFCYAQYPDQDESNLYAYPDSNGCAAGNTIEEAILQGFLELIERDATAIWWYNRLRRPAVDLKTANNSFLEEMEVYYQSIGRNMWVLDITPDLGIPVFVAISQVLNPTDGKEKILYAFGAHLDAHIAIERAVIELNQLLPLIGDEEYLTEDQTFIDWLNQETLEKNEYLKPAKVPAKDLQKDYATLCEPTIQASINHLLKVTQEQGLETLVLELTQPDIGLPVVKVIVPGLRHFWRRTAPGRLYEVPVKMGWLAQPLKEEELNPIGIFI